MPKPVAKPETDPLDELETAAYADLKAAIESGDDVAGVAALRDFVKACIERNEGGEYEAE